MMRFSSFAPNRKGYSEYKKSYFRLRLFVFFVKILLADDHPMIQKGLSFLIRDAFPLAIIKSVYNGDQVVEELNKVNFDLLILDINMPTMSFQVFEYLVERHPQLRILMYSQNSEEQHALRYLKGGAAGYVEKSCDDETLIAAMKKVLAGEKYFSRQLSELMLNKLQGKNKENPFENLSNREYDVALMMMKGCSMGTIGDQLHLSPSTVSTYKNRLYEKLNVKNQVEFIEMAKQFNLK
jgi:two-component system, NarL family, invasion response regulator UvrY